jgi:hypothetical protein
MICRAAAIVHHTLVSVSGRLRQAACVDFIAQWIRILRIQGYRVIAPAKFRREPGGYDE